MIYSIHSFSGQGENYICLRLGASYNGNIFHDKCLRDLIHENKSYSELNAGREDAIKNIGETANIGAHSRSLREIELAMILVKS